MRRSAPIDTGTLLMALEHHDPDISYYLDLETGEVEFISEAYSETDEREAFFARLDADPDRYAAIEPVPSREGWRIMSDFIEQLPESEARERLDMAIHRNRPFRRFKDTLLDYPDLRQQWFRYHEDRFLELAREWLEVEEIEAELQPLPGREPEPPKLRIVPRGEPQERGAGPPPSTASPRPDEPPVRLWTSTSPRLYGDLAWVWPFLSPPEEYVEEVEVYSARFREHGVPEGGSILHLGSGGGSIDFHLKKRFRVTGVDLSPAMLQHARGVNPEVEYLPGDLRTVRLGRTFDGVLLHDAASYLTTLDELRTAYRTAAAHLRPGGVMVTLPEELRSRFVQHGTSVTTRSQGERTVTTVELDFDPDPTDHSIETTYVFLIREGDQLTVETDTHHVGLFDLDEMLDAMRQEGFEPVVTHLELSDLPPGGDYPLVTAIRRG